MYFIISGSPKYFCVQKEAKLPSLKLQLRSMSTVFRSSIYNLLTLDFTKSLGKVCAVVIYK